jgi:prepilin-type N-terminal cleavage/methylation domain-containing protein
MNNNFFKKINSKSGFTLLETMVAIMLFVIALSALLALVRDSVTSSTYTRNEVVATYLAQEGVDYIRNIRDEMVYVNPTISPWSDFTYQINTTGGCGTAGGCHLDLYSLNKLTACPIPPSTCPTTPIQPNNKPFIRKITTMAMGTDALLVKVEVTWLNGSLTRTRTLTTSLYNWAL